MVLKSAALLLLLMAGVVSAGALQSDSKNSCREHPQLIGKCFRLHGRLSVYNGAPAVRLWRVGTSRMLGVSEQRFNDPGYRNLPESLEQKLTQDNEIFGDFLVCPFTRSKPGEMQLICIESATKLRIQMRK